MGQRFITVRVSWGMQIREDFLDKLVFELDFEGWVRFQQVAFEKKAFLMEGGKCIPKGEKEVGMFRKF